MHMTWFFFSSTRNGMQTCLDKLSLYCKQWGLQINLEKTKCLTFNFLGRISTVKFQIDGKFIENLKHFTYLGITVSASDCFNEARNVIYNKGMKAYYLEFLPFFTFFISSDVWIRNMGCI